jgi:starch synthase
MSVARELPGKAPRRARARRASGAVSRKRTIVHVTAEYYPHARTGGLAEAVAGLATYQARAGENVVVFVPLYPSVRQAEPDLSPLSEPQMVVIGELFDEVRFFGLANPSPGPRLIFIDAPRYFAREGLYGEHGADYPDNHRRFALFARAALDGVRQFVTGPVLLHAHDWHSALLPLYLRAYRALGSESNRTPVVLSVHNAGYQGHFPLAVIEELGLLWDAVPLDRVEWYGQLNMLKAGLTTCDLAVTVSPTHAGELCTPEGGFGLDHTFRELGPRLIGICNGIDTDVWNPEHDPQIAAHFSRASLAGKAACKEALQRTFGMTPRPDVPLIGMAARLVKQKGFDIVLKSRRAWSSELQFIFLGMGEPWYQAALSELAAARPQEVVVEFGFTDALEHRLIAGADIVLMPSLYEPCGLTQMRAQRYGAPVIGRLVGGIGDTVEDDATGFLFGAFDEFALDEAIDRAVTLFADHPAWHRMMKRAMARDFGWEAQAALYDDAYRSAEQIASMAE